MDVETWKSRCCDCHISHLFLRAVNLYILALTLSDLAFGE